MGNQDKEKKRQRVSSSDAKAETNEEVMDSQDSALILLTVTEYLYHTLMKTGEDSCLRTAVV